VPFGLDLDNQLVEVGALFDASRFDRVGDARIGLNEASSCRRPIGRTALEAGALRCRT
jgi:hypothetical protein